MPHGPAGGNSSELSTVLAGISSRSANMTLAWQFLRELTANADNQSMLFTDSHSVSALRSVTDSDETRRTLRQDTPGESRNGVEMLSDVMEQAVAAPRFRNYDQALLLTEGLVQTAMEDEHNLSLQPSASSTKCRNIYRNNTRIYRRLALCLCDTHRRGAFSLRILIAGMTFVI